MHAPIATSAVLVVPADGLWNAADILPASGAYRLADERPDRWRIYRATPSPLSRPE